MKNILLAVIGLTLTGNCFAQLAPQTLSRPTQNVTQMGDNLILTLKNVTANIDRVVAENHAVIFAELGKSGSKALIVNTIAKGAVNASQLAVKLTPAESVRILTALSDLQAGNAINATVTNITPQETLIVQFAAMSYQSAALEGAATQVAQPFIITPNPDGTVTTAPFPPEPKPPVTPPSPE